MQAASGHRPEIRKLADVIDRLGELSGGVTAPAAAPHDVAALSVEEAVDRWGEFTSKPR